MVGVGADVRGGEVIDASVALLGAAIATAARVTVAEKVKTAAEMARLEERERKRKLPGLRRRRRERRRRR